MTAPQPTPPAPPAPPPAPPAPPAPPPEPTFPANTPVEQMTDAQQAAYWKHHSRQHEGRAKQLRDTLGDLTPDQFKELREKAERQDALEAELASDAEKREKAARETAVSEADSKYRPLLAETAFRVAIGDRKPQAEVDEFIADLNLPRFLSDDGKVDTAKVLARVEQFAPAKGTPPPKGPTVTGHGTNGSGSGGGLSSLSGSELYDHLHPKKPAAT